MKKTVLLLAITLAGLLFTSLQSMAQVSYDSLCASYKTYYSLEEALKEPLNVQKLDLSMQKLTVIPEDVMKLENLICLDLSFNRISTLPASLTTLTKLECLNLTGTRYMAKLPAVVSKLPSLKVLGLGDHPEWSAATFDEAVKLLPNVTVIK
jgi:hypothetical protein